MKILRGIVLLFCLLSLVLLNPSIAHADHIVGSVEWQTVGGGCIPDDEAVQGNWYQAVTAAGRVKYRGNHTNTLRFTCPVTNVNASTPLDFTELVIYYQDPDGPGDDFQVIGRLMSFSKSDGTLSETCRVESDQFGSWSSTVSSTTSQNCGTLDFVKNLYWVEATISRREASSLTVEFNGAELMNFTT
ncbi:hypothetical protein [Brasilonema sp. UFV-L1]|uniref:hypothetical protein n=1 Tax=Brasilonema sp. UFV-L1 TaxID=2234130 RepID=UPI00145D2E12|nr:hypothetical protein [Brasilonema sp. UFV-L1]NMG06316.1 hypothetical protein [Brasilonema sp. UFV-L1]